MKYFYLFAAALSCSSCSGQESDTAAQHFRQSATIELNGPVNDIFPLFGIMEEKKWTPDWDPTPVYPATGEIREGAVFRTPGHVHGESPLTWVITRYDPQNHAIVYTVVAANRVIQIAVTCVSIAQNRTKATITYDLTGLSAQGNTISHHSILNMFAHELRDWQEAINRYIANRGH